MARRGPSPWAIRIDYAQAIAEDEKNIVICERALANGWFVPAAWAGYYCGLSTLVMFGDAPVSGLDLSDEDRAALVAFYYNGRGEGVPPAHVALVEVAYKLDGWYKRGCDVDLRLDALAPGGLLTEEQWRARLKKAKTWLARHKRNAKKFGP